MAESLKDTTNTPPAVRSMTGFARAAQASEGIAIEVEVRSVNHRFFEVAYKAPRSYAVFERDARAIFQKDHRRGRIDVTVIRRVTDKTLEKSQDWDACDTLVKSYTEACRRYGVTGEHLAGFLAQVVLREAGRSEESGEITESEAALVLSALRDASEALSVMREQEGNWLAEDITRRVETIEEMVERITPWAAELPGRYRERLDERLKSLVPGVAADPVRVAQEVAFMADRTDISEELSRLGSHLTQFRTTLGGSAEGIGRRLDFLIQEIGRELNTIGSKAQDARIQGVIVEAKSELEKIREQVQNVE